LTATLIEVAGTKHPREYRGRAVTPLAGESFAGLLRGETWGRAAPLFWEHEGNSAARRENWKLVRMHPGAWELYDLERDRTELVNQADRYPDLVRELSISYDDWARRCGVLDWEKVRKLPRL
jgi:arylsulfatase